VRFPDRLRLPSRPGSGALAGDRSRIFRAAVPTAGRCRRACSTSCAAGRGAPPTVVIAGLVLGAIAATAPRSRTRYVAAGAAYMWRADGRRGRAHRARRRLTRDRPACARRRRGPRQPVGFAVVYLGEHYLAGLAVAEIVRRGEPHVAPLVRAVAHALE
jgi:hypothetical protein